MCQRKLVTNTIFGTDFLSDIQANETVTEWLREKKKGEDTLTRKNASGALWLIQKKVSLSLSFFANLPT